jgi:hypothetical protein
MLKTCNRISIEIVRKSSDSCSGFTGSLSGIGEERDGSN